MTKKCNPEVGAVPVNVIMIVLQIRPTYQTCIYFAEKLMVLRCYDHNLNTDCKRRLWIWSGLFSVAFYENAAVSILRTAIYYVDPPHTSLVPQTIPNIFSSGIPNLPQMIAGLRPRHCSWRVCAAIACHNNTHNCDVCFFRFPNENYGDRYVLIMSSMKLM